MTDFPALGQQAPNYWRDQLKAYIDEGDDRFDVLLNSLDVRATTILDLNAAPLGYAYAWGDSANRPAGFGDVVVQTVLTGLGTLQWVFEHERQSMNLGKGRIAVRTKEGDGGWGPWRVQDSDGLRTAVANTKRFGHMTGGGAIYHNAEGITWTGRFMLIAQGSEGLGAAAFQNVYAPPAGTAIPGHGGAPSLVVTSQGRIPVSDWSTLFYETNPESGDSDPSKFHVVGYTVDFEVPATWVMIATINPDLGFSMAIWGNGVVTRASGATGASYDPGASIPLSGDGFPEDVVSATANTEYSDHSQFNGACKWIKTGAGYNAQGWKVMYGDTGWRDVSGSLMNGWVKKPGGQVLLRRRNHTVTLYLFLLDGSAATDDVFLPVFPGFAAQQYVIQPVNAGIPSSTGRFILRPNTSFDLQSIRHNELITSIDWSTDEQWPTVLPG